MWLTDTHRPRRPWPTARLLMAALVGALALAALGPPVRAQTSAPALTWQRYDVDLAIQRDGSMAVSETQQLSFRGTLQHGFRVVPLDRTTGATDVRVEEVVGGRSVAYTAGADRPNTFRSAVAADSLHVDWWFGPTTDGTRTFVVRYTVAGAVRVYDGGDQLQWRAIYADRPGPVSASTVSVHLPADVAADALHTAFYAFGQDSRGALSAAGTGQQVDPRSVRFETGSLPAGTGAEVRVQFPHGLIATGPPPWQADADRADWVQQTVAPLGTFVALLVTLGVLAGGGVALLLLWRSGGRDPGVGTVPRVLAEPPSDLPAPLAGALVDGVADVQDAVATLVDLAQRGFLTLADVPDPRGSGQPRDAQVILRSSLDDRRLRRYERVLLTALFGTAPLPGAEIAVSQSRGRLVAAIPVVRDRLHAAMQEEGLFVRDPEQTRRRYRAIGFGVAGGGVLLAGVLAIVLGWAVPVAWLPGAALAVVGLALVGLARAMPRRTPAGALEAARWRAFRAHLLASSQRADGTGQQALAGQYLPYAVAFGLDRTFLRRLEDAGAPPPTWYGGPGYMPGGVVILPGGGWYGGPWAGGPVGRGGPAPVAQSGGPGGPPAANPQGWSDALAAVLNAASESLAHGGGSGDWSGGGFGGGGGGGGGSGGFN